MEISKKYCGKKVMEDSIIGRKKKDIATEGKVSSNNFQKIILDDLKV